MSDMTKKPNKICPSCKAVSIHNQWKANVSLTAEEKKSVKKTLCPVCSRAKSGYFEGILQLRNVKSSSYDEAVEFIRQDMSLNPNIFISKMKQSKDGIDIYLSSGKYIQKIGKKMGAMYGMQPKLSRKLFSRDRQTGKEVYRLTLLIRFPDYGRYDTAIIPNKILYITNLTRDWLFCIDLKTGKKHKSKAADIVRIIKQTDYKEVTVSKTKPELEIIHPENYQNTRVENPRTVKDEHAWIVVIEGRLFLLPSSWSPGMDQL